MPLVILPSPYRSIVGPLLDFLERNRPAAQRWATRRCGLARIHPGPDGGESLLHNQTAWLIKAALLYNGGVLAFSA